MSRFERDGAMRNSAPATRSSRSRSAVLLHPVRRRRDPRRRRARSIPGSATTSSRRSAGRPSWVADRLPLAERAARARPAGSRPTSELGGGGFDDAAERAAHGAAAGAAGDRRRLRPGRDRRDAAPPEELETLLVTGDSLSTPLDTELARRLAPRRRRGDPRPAPRRPGSRTRDSSTGASSRPGRSPSDEPDAVVVFIGANEGYPMPGPDGEDVECCGPEYAAIYANRVRQVMDNYRQDGAAKVYWLTVMAPRDPSAQRSIDLVNAAIRGRGPAVGEPGPGRRHGPDLHPGRRLPRLDGHRRRGHDRPRVRRHPPQRRRAQRSPPRLVLDGIDQDFTR